MPRTKQRRGRGNDAELEQKLRDANRLFELKLHQVEVEHKSMQQKFLMNMDMTINRFPTEIQNMSCGELFKIEKTPQKKKENQPPPKTPGTTVKKPNNVKSTVKRAKRTTTTSTDDGYQSEPMNGGAKTVGPSTTKKQRRSRSASQASRRTATRSMSAGRKSRLVATTQKDQKDVPKTPKVKTNNSFVITPKIKMNSAVNVLRKPKNGEMVFSTEGSPLLVSTTCNDRTANINVPLLNGNIMSLLPIDDSLSENLVLDEETRNQLRILKNHLEKVIDN